MKSYLIRKYKDSKPGQILAAVIPCIIPVRLYSLRVLVSKESNYQLGGEFVLKAIQLNLRTSSEISQFLGLELEITSSYIASEIQAGHVYYDYQNKLTLSEKGLETLANLKVVRMFNTEVDIQIDQVTGSMVSYTGLAERLEDVAAVSNFEIGPDDELLALNPPRLDRPVRSFFNLFELNSMQSDRTLQIVEQYGLTPRRPFKERFKLAWLLVYVESGTDLFSCEIVINGSLSTEHQIFVNEGTFLVKHQISISSPQSAPNIVDFLNDMKIDQFDKKNDYVEMYRELENVDSELASIDVKEPNLNIYNEPDTPKGMGKFLVQNKVPSRLSVFEHATILNEALKYASQRLFIVSPWITNKVVSDSFIDLIRKALKRGVDITIVFGYEDGAGNSSKALKLLLSLQSLGLQFLRHQNTHAKILIADNTVVMTSFNWLSFMGSKDRTYRMEEGTEIRSKDFADKLYVDLKNQMSIEARVADSSILIS